jgi:hypothetical protein
VVVVEEQPAMVGPVRKAGPPSVWRFFVFNIESAAIARRRPTGRLRRGWIPGLRDQ